MHKFTCSSRSLNKSFYAPLCVGSTIHEFSNEQCESASMDSFINQKEAINVASNLHRRIMLAIAISYVDIWLTACRVNVRAGWRARWLWQRRRWQHLIILQLPVGLSASFVLCRFICSLSCPCRHHENHTKHRHLLQVLLGTTHRRLRLSVADFGSPFHGHSALKDNILTTPS